MKTPGRKRRASKEGIFRKHHGLRRERAQMEIYRGGNPPSIPGPIFF